MPGSALLSTLIERICAESAMQGRSLPASVAALNPEEALELENYLNFCDSEGWNIDRMAQAYLTIANDTLREQMFFRRNHRYRHSRFESVAAHVYFDDDYMARYMYGLALTLYLWPNHLQIFRHYQKSIARSPGGSYLEVGPGHGAFFRHALLSGKFQKCVGVDISPTSLRMTKRILQSAGAKSEASWSLIEANLLEASNLGDGYDTIVMGEVLEHVERPDLFLQRIRDLAAPNAMLYVTTAVNAPAVDHIYLFRSVKEVEQLASTASLIVRETFATPYVGCTMQQTVEQQLPINVALVLSR